MTKRHFWWTKVLTAVVLLVAGSRASAQVTYTWTGAAAGGGNWAAPQSWNANGVPLNDAVNSDVVFTGTSSLINTVNLLLNGQFDIRTLTFAAGAGTFNITATNTNPTTLGIGTGGIVVNSANTQTISNPLALAADHSWNAASGRLFIDGPVAATGRTLTFAGGNDITVSQSGTITGGALVKTGTGNTTLSANNTPASIAVDQGTLIVNKVGAGSPIGSGPVTLGGGTLSFRVFGNPVAATGYNHDVVTSIADFAGGAPYGTTRGVNGANGNGPFVYFQAGASAGNPTFGLPANGRFTANSVNYQFQDYTGNNVLSLGGGGTGSLTLDTPGAYRSLNLMNVTGNGSSVFSFTLNFGDGTSTTVTNQASPDWFNGPSPVFIVNGRLNRNTGAFADIGSNNPRIYTTNYNLSAADQLKMLQSIDFAPATGGTFNVFGLSGTAGANSQTYANSVALIADSTIDQQNVADITLGALSIGSNTLTMTGVAGSTLTMGAATLSGNPTFDSASTALTLGAINDGGAVRTITLNGGGALRLAATAASATPGTNVVINGGTVSANAAGAIGTGANVSVGTGGTFDLGANQSIRSLSNTASPIGSAVTLNGNTLTIGDATNASSSFVGAIRNGTAPGNLIKNGAGTLTLNGPSTYSGTTTINAGTLNAPQPGGLGTSAVTIANGATLAIGADRVAIADFGGFTLNGGATAAGQTLTLTTGVAGQSRSAFFNQATVPTYGFQAGFTFNNPNGADGITFSLQNDPRGATALGVGGGELGYGGAGGPGAVSPSVALAMNIYTGNPPVPGVNLLTNGVVVATGYANPPSIALGNGVPIAVTIEYDGTNLITNYDQAGTLSGPVSTPFDLAAILGPSAVIGFTGATGGVTATMEVSNFTYTSSSTVNYANAVAVPAAASSNLAVFANTGIANFGMGPLSVGSAGTLLVAPQVGSAANAGYGVTFGATTLTGMATFDVANNGTGTGKVSLGVVADGGSAGSFNKVGAGTLILPAVNTFTGTATVTGGKVQVDGSLAAGSSVMVGNGGTLGGGGVINGRTTTIVSGGAIAPGSSPGTLTFADSALNLQTGSRYLFEIDNAGTAAVAFNDGSSTNAGHDQVAVTGTGVATLGNIVLEISELGGFAASFTAANTSYSWTIVNSAGLTAGATPTINTSNAPALSNALANSLGTLSLNTSGNQFNLNYSPVPEPATVLAWCAGTTLIGGWIRRRRAGK